jgi:hypothetical protein
VTDPEVDCLFWAELPAVDDDNCVSHLLAWLAYPTNDASDQRRRSDLAAALLAWGWRNALHGHLVGRKDVPARVKSIPQRDMLGRIEAMHRRLRKANFVLRAWRPVRAAKLGVSITVNGGRPTLASMADIFGGEGADDARNWQKRTFAQFSPVLHLFEQFDEVFTARFDEWQAHAERWEQRAKLGGSQNWPLKGEEAARAILQLMADRAWVERAVAAAEALRTTWNAEAGLEANKTIQFRLQKCAKSDPSQAN